MAGWKMEVFRMSLYVFFPLSMYGLFNNNQFAAQAIKEARIILNRDIDLKACQAMEEAANASSRRQREKQLKEIKSFNQ